MQRVSKRWLRHGTVAGIASAFVAFALLGFAARATSPPSYECDGANPIYLNTNYGFAERAADLVSCMSLGQEVPSCTPTARRRFRASACSSTGTGARASTGSTP